MPHVLTRSHRPLRSLLTLSLALAPVGCGQRESDATKQQAAVAPVGAPAAPAPTPAPAVDEDKEAYIPAEFKSGADRWRDTGVYVDGKFVGLLSFAELPVALKPIWLKVKASAPKRYGTTDTGWRWAKERRYRFTEYLEAIGLDLKAIKEVHVYGPKYSDSIVATGKDLRSKRAEGFLFRFGGMVSGKALPVVPEGFGNGRSPDKVSAVMIYVEKTPPKLVRNVGFVVDNEVQEGVPYFGTPLRGGVRVYLDDRMAAYIKRQDLPPETRKAADGEPQWKLFDYLKSQGVNVEVVVEGWVVRGEKWEEKLTRAELEGMYFQASAQAKGNIELGDNKVKAQSIILRSRPVAQADVPVADPDEL